jgi:hypothetical protein
MIAWFKTLDAGCAHVLPAFARLVLYGVTLGALSMLIYWKLSPQRRLAALKHEIGDARRALRAHNGSDGRETLRLSGRAVSLSLRQLLLVAGPTVLAAAPVVLAMVCIGPAFGPAVKWTRSWELPFMAGLSTAALGMKFALKIA